jgi:hypothetical protein
MEKDEVGAGGGAAGGAQNELEKEGGGAVGGSEIDEEGEELGMMILEAGLYCTETGEGAHACVLIEIRCSLSCVLMRSTCVRARI